MRVLRMLLQMQSSKFSYFAWQSIQRALALLVICSAISLSPLGLKEAQAKGVDCKVTKNKKTEECKQKSKKAKKSINADAANPGKLKVVSNLTVAEKQKLATCKVAKSESTECKTLKKKSNAKHAAKLPVAEQIAKNNHTQAVAPKTLAESTDPAVVEELKKIRELLDSLKKAIHEK